MSLCLTGDLLNDNDTGTVGPFFIVENASCLAY